MDYLSNCMLLLLPIMAWNMAFHNKLPRMYSSEVFDMNIPSAIVNGENIFRLIVFTLPVLMPLRVEMPVQQFGLWFYIVGTMVYFLSWLAQMIFPQSRWSLSAPGFLAPAYTPFIWLVGISLIGSTLYFVSFYQSWMYISVSVVFVGFHLAHGWTVYSRNFR